MFCDLYADLRAKIFIPEDTVKTRLLTSLRSEKNIRIIQWSGHGGSNLAAMAQEHRFPLLQVGNSIFLYARKSDNRCLLLVPCPQVLFGVLSDCLDSALLLLMSGDVEANPGPKPARSQTDNADKTPGQTIEGAQADMQQNEILSILRELHSQSATNSASHIELKETIAEIRSSQLNVESALETFGNRVAAVEQKIAKFEDIYEEVRPAVVEFDGLQNQNNLLQSRLSELEDRARRDNLVFHGIADAKESWEETEKKILSLLVPLFNSEVTGQDIARVDRLDQFSLSRWRPLIVKFTNVKTREKVF